MSSAALVFDYERLAVEQANPPTLEALVAQVNRHVASAAADVNRTATTVVDIANAFVVTDDTEPQATEYLVEWKRAEKDGLARFDPICRSAYETHQTATAERARAIAPFQQGASILSRKVAAHLAEKKRLALEAEREQLEAARLVAAQERESEIESAELSGASREEVSALCDMPLPPAPLASSPRRAIAASPVSLRTTYKGRVTNHLALVQHIVKNPHLLSLIPVDQAALNKLAGALKTAARLPGVEFYTENSTSTRTAARRS